MTIFKAYDVRGLYGEQIDGDVAYEIGRAFARVLGGGRIGLGRDMRLTAPELAARYREGLTDEGAHVVDAGMVGTEMLYWLVGSRDLDGGLMCTASHNPKAYTGAKMVGRGAVPADIDEVERAIGRSRRASGRRYVRGGRHLRGLPASGTRLHRPERREAAEGRRRRRQRHGRPDGRPAARPARARPRHDLLGAGRRVPRPRAEPAARGEPPLHRRQGALRAGRPGHRLGRRRRPLLLHRRHRPLRRRGLPHRPARRVGAREAAGRRHPLRRPRLAGGARHRRASSAAART